MAVFGLGDSVSYAENYCDGMGELYDVFEGLGATMIGSVSAGDYEHEESKAQRGDMFCGLALDMVNFEELTEERVDAWIEKLKSEGLLEGGSSSGSSAVSSSPPAPAAQDAPEESLMAKLENENA